MEEPTSNSKITLSLLLLRVKPFTPSNSNVYYFITCNGKSSTSLASPFVAFVTTAVITFDKVTTTSSVTTSCQEKDNVVSSSCLRQGNQDKESLCSPCTRVPLSETSAFNKDYFCTFILLVLVLGQVTQTSYFQKTLQNNSSEDLNFNSSCT